MLDLASALRALSTFLGWFVVGSIALVAMLLLVNSGVAGPQMSGAVWAGVVVAIAVLLCGRVLIPRLFEALAIWLLPDDARSDDLQRRGSSRDDPK
jgi:uncharacterized membrane protein